MHGTNFRTSGRSSSASSITPISTGGLGKFFRTLGPSALLGAVVVVVAGCSFSSLDFDFYLVQPTQLGLLKPTGQAQLIAYQSLPEMDPELCMMVPASGVMMAALQQERLPLGISALPSGQAALSDPPKRAPLRVVRDSYPAFSSIAVDMLRDEVVVTDENLFQILVFDRLANTAPNAITQPKRTIGGSKTRIAFQCGLYLDQRSGEIYSISNDSEELPVFSREARGDVPPDRELEAPHGTFGMAADEERQELFLTVQHDSAVVVFRKTASGKEDPIRLLQGDNTRLADPHGIAVDSKNNLIFVTNYGSVHRVSSDAGAWLDRVQDRAVHDEYLSLLNRVNWPLDRNFAVPGSGQILPPSITVYARTASGDTPPLRVIEGPKTQLNWPTGIAMHPGRGELFIANDAGHSILVFEATARGNVAPIRVLKGPQTGLKNPTGLFVDTKNNELWVADFGNHTATAYPITAQGNTPPLRTIRSAPAGIPSLMIGNPGAVAYDSKREEILVPN